MWRGWLRLLYFSMGASVAAGAPIECMLCTAFLIELALLAQGREKVVEKAEKDAEKAEEADAEKKTDAEETKTTDAGRTKKTDVEEKKKVSQCLHLETTKSGTNGIVERITCKQCKALLFFRRK